MSDDTDDNLVQALHGLLARPDGRRELMALRSSLHQRSGISQQAVAFMSRWARPAPTDAGLVLRRRLETAERNRYLLAGLFALWHTGSHASPRNGRDIGAALAQLSRRNAAEAGLRDVTTLPLNGISSTLVRLVTQLARENIALDWSDLDRALQSPTPAAWQQAQRRWAVSFHNHH